MTTNYNPNIQTFNERPCQEATKATSFVNKYLYWMTNKSNQEAFHNAFGKVMGDHFWEKLMGLREKEGTFGGDMCLWLEMTNINRDLLMNYIIKTGYKGQ